MLAGRRTDRGMQPWLERLGDSGYRRAVLFTCCISRKLRWLLCSLLVAMPLSRPACAAGSLHFLSTPNGNITSPVNGVSADGSVVVGGGSDDGSTARRAFRWTQSSGLTGLGSLNGGSFSDAKAVSADGSVIVGSADDGMTGPTRAFRWTESGGMQSIGTFPGGEWAEAYGVNADGSVVVGFAAVANGATYAFRWTQASGMVSLGAGNNGLFSRAWGVSADGSTVVGDVWPVELIFNQAFRWTAATGLVNLGALRPGGGSGARAASADGTIVVGFTEVDTTPSSVRAFRWTPSTGMMSLGTIPGGTDSSAHAMTPDGSVIVGSARDRMAILRAMRWTAGTGMQTVEDWLRASGVSVPSDVTFSSEGVSADGSVVVGTLQDINTGFVARLNGPQSGLMSLAQLAASLSEAGQVPSVALDAAALVLHGAHGRPLSKRVQPGKSCFWAAGDWGRDDHGSRDGSVGVAEVGGCRSLGPRLQANLALGKTRSRQRLGFGGHAALDGTYALAQVMGALPWEGLWTTVTGYHHDGDADVRRGYLNAGAPDSSAGNTNTRTSGASVRLDWENAAQIGRVALTPHGKLSYMRTRTDAYAESGGGFPAAFDRRGEHATEARLGATGAIALDAQSRVLASIEGVHRFQKTGARTTGRVIGLFGFDLPGQDRARDWLHASAGYEVHIGAGLASVFVNATTRGQDPNFWVFASYQLTF